MKKIDLYIDCDGVVIDSVDIINQALLKANISEDSFYTDNNQISYILRNMYDLKFMESCEVIDFAIEKLQVLNDSPLFDLHILSHVNSVTEALAKLEYFQSRIPGIDVICIDRLIPKYSVINPKDAILIDDLVSNIDAFNAAGGYGLLFDVKCDSDFERICNIFDVFGFVNVKFGGRRLELTYEKE